MLFKADTMEELNLLLQFDSTNMMNGIKVHATARPEIVAASGSLFAKGLITQPDGGYLTDEGIEALNHAQILAGLMRSAEEGSQ